MRFCFRRSTSELFDIASNAAKPHKSVHAWGGASIKMKLGRTVSFGTTKDRSANFQLGHQLDHLLTSDECHPALFLYATPMANIFKRSPTRRRV
ncbi:BQ5605_C026g10185 [Microbotryum silenes-dioicae]|uniref:BQ5605_C026g10185 protein n=1 Tax=Microbotryum silenes-dioicae TaxID=796604 RepID=A0A2X0MRF4_9BASI|nr:BQ5605_C026g10185 [Microbotryum silenes-dioicae]